MSPERDYSPETRSEYLRDRLPLGRRDYLRYTGVAAIGSLGMTDGAAAQSEDGEGDNDTAGGSPLPTNLRAEHEHEPNNLQPDGNPPRFSWEMSADQRGTTQVAYRLLAADSVSALQNENGTIWDSGRVESSQSTSVEYGGPALDPNATYYWMVRVWNQTGTASDWSEPSSFSTALPTTTDAWEGTWIGQQSDDGLPGADWTDYTYASDFTIENQAAGFVFRASGMDNLYMWQIVLESSPDNSTDTHLLRPHIAVNGNLQPLSDAPLGEAGIPIDDVLEGAESSQHRFRIELDGNEFTTYIDDQQVDVTTDSTHSEGTIGFRAFNRSGGGEDERALYDSVQVTAPDGTELFVDEFEHSSVAHFSGGTIRNGHLLLDGTDIVLRSESGVNSHNWADYTLEMDFTVVNGAAGPVFRAQNVDNFYMWQINTARGPPPLLRPHIRVDGSYQVLDPVSLEGVLGDTPYEQHHLRIEINGDQFTTYIDGQQVDQRSDSTHAQGSIGFRQSAPSNEHARYDNLEVMEPNGDVRFSDGFDHTIVRHFTGGDIEDGQLSLDSTGIVLRGDREGESSPLLRTETTLDGSVAEARAHIATLGYGELHINGARVSNAALEPWTAFGNRVLYTTLDVTDALNSGSNALGLWLGRGWFSKSFANWQSYGNPRGLMQLHVTFENGETRTVTTDTSWQTAPSPVLENDVYDGETYDAREERTGWATPSYDAAEWEPAAELESPANPPSEEQFNLEPQRLQPREEVATLEPEAIIEQEDGYVVDFGQNHTGWAELSISGANAGSKITLQYAEILDDRGTQGEDNPNGVVVDNWEMLPDNSTGDIYTENLRGADQTDVYVTKGTGTEVYEPRFTYHGYRYVKITGYPGELTTDEINSKLVHTGFEKSSSFESSNEDLQQVQKNSLRSQRSVSQSLPIDCPQRDERQGWTGDTHMTARSQLFNFDAYRFFEKYMDDHDDNQSSEGTQTDTIPHANGSRPGDPNWTRTRVTIPWYMYLHSGDTQVLSTRYDGLKEYVDYWDQVAENRIVPAGANNYGDWLAPRESDINNDLALLNTFSHYQTTEIVARVAETLGRTDEAEQYRNRATAIGEAFNDQFFDPDADVYGSGDMTTYALPLYAGIVPDEHEEQVAENLDSTIREDYDGKIGTGFVGTRPLLFTLVEHGYVETAYEIVSQPEEPGWVFMIRNGATTQWERWDAPDYGPGLNSLNHRNWTLISEWFYRVLAGINVAEPGFEEVSITPHVVDDLDHAGGSIDTVRGEVSSRWERTETPGAGLTLDVTIPGNTSGTVRVPTLGSEEVRVRENGNPIWDNGNRTRPNHPGVESVERDGDRVVIEVGSGEYQFALQEGDGPPPVVGDSPPTDLDSDGLYEDVNGDGEANYADIVDLFEHYNDDAVQNSSTAFDFNRNSRMDFDDIVELFQSM